MKASSMKDKKLIITSIVLIIGLWAIGGEVINNSIYLPKIQDLAKELVYIITEREFFIDIVNTIFRTIKSFTITLVIAIALGIMAAFNKYIYNFLYPIMAVCKSIPTIAFVLIALIWFDKDIAPILIGVIIAFPILYEVVQSSVFNLDKDILYMSQVYKIPKIDMIFKIYLPNIYYNLLNISNSTLSLILKVIIAGEVYGQPLYGIGAKIQLEKINLNTTGIFAWILIVAVITIGFDLVLQIINRKDKGEKNYGI